MSPADAMPDAGAGERRGRLVVVGSGIRAIAQLTLEAIAHIDGADRVHYGLAEPATEHWLRERRPDAMDLGELYGTGKPRIDTYVQMAERLLVDVRRGLTVTAVFYGHPGYFVTASHRAIAIARDEGYEAVMLPAISAEDSLFADIGIDPATVGSQTLEATDLLVARRELLTDAYVVLLQVGFVGLLDFDHAESGATRKLGVLLDYLESFYSPDHEFIHYIGAQYPTTAPVMEPMTIKGLRSPAMAAQLRPESTWCIPPSVVRESDPEMAKLLGLRVKRPREQPGAYGPAQRRAAEALCAHTTPTAYRHARADPRTYALVRDLALDPRLRERFQRRPADVLAGRRPVAPDDVAIIARGEPLQVRALLRRSRVAIAQSFLRCALDDAELRERLCVAARAADGPAAVNAMLAEAGYDTSAAELPEALAALSRRRLAAWAGEYELTASSGRGAILRIEPSRALLDGTPIRGARFADRTLSWSDQGRDFCGSLRFERDGGVPRCTGSFGRCGSDDAASSLAAQPSRAVADVTRVVHALDAQTAR